MASLQNVEHMIFEKECMCTNYHKWLQLKSLNFQIPLHKAGMQRRYSRKILSKHDIDSPSSVLSDGK